MYIILVADSTLRFASIIVIARLVRATQFLFRVGMGHPDRAVPRDRVMTCLVVSDGAY
jgi:hypothetical protein